MTLRPPVTLGAAGAAARLRGGLRPRRRRRFRHAARLRRRRPDRDPRSCLLEQLDLDPGPGAGLLDCCAVALRARELLRELGLEALVKTSGSAGLHVIVPLNTPHGYEETKPFARRLARWLAEAEPERVVDRTPLARREGRVLVDWLANDASRTIVAPYSLRAADLPTVSAPVSWEEVETALRERAPQRLTFTAADMPARLDAIGDPLAPALDLRQRLPAAYAAR